MPSHTAVALLGIMLHTSAASHIWPTVPGPGSCPICLPRQLLVPIVCLPSPSPYSMAMSTRDQLFYYSALYSLATTVLPVPLCVCTNAAHLCLFHCGSLSSSHNLLALPSPWISALLLPRLACSHIWSRDSSALHPLLTQSQASLFLSLLADGQLIWSFQTVQ